MTDSEPWVATVTDLKESRDRGCRAVAGRWGPTTPGDEQLSAIAASSGLRGPRGPAGTWLAVGRARRGAGGAHHGSEVRRPGVSAPQDYRRGDVFCLSGPKAAVRRHPLALAATVRAGALPLERWRTRRSRDGAAASRALPVSSPAAVALVILFIGCQLRHSRPSPLCWPLTGRARRWKMRPVLSPQVPIHIAVGIGWSRMYLMPLGTLHFDPPHPSRPRAAPCASKGGGVRRLRRVPSS